MLEHGGTDLGPVVRWDFSTNANAMGALPEARAALQQADRRAYPEPSYAALRAQLADAVQAPPERIWPTAGNAEGIRRLTLAAKLAGCREVWLPHPGYGEYAAAAASLGLVTRRYDGLAALLQAWQSLNMQPTWGRADPPPLIWLCEPCNPTGQIDADSTWARLSLALTQGALGRPGGQPHIAIDRAYEPLRLDGRDPVPMPLAQASWQLWSPNKALGLTGVRAGVMVSPSHRGNTGLQGHVAALAPSWVLSAEGVALLQAWAQPAVQRGLQAQRRVLAAWCADQSAMLQGLGWAVRPSCVPFMLAHPPVNDLVPALQALRASGIKLRDASSLGLPGWVRLRAMPPEARTDLAQAWRRLPVDMSPPLRQTHQEAA